MRLSVHQAEIIHNDVEFIRLVLYKVRVTTVVFAPPLQVNGVRGGSAPLALLLFQSLNLLT